MYSSSTTLLRRFLPPMPKRARIPSMPALRQHARQSRMRRATPAMTPITIPAIAPPDSPPPPDGTGVAVCAPVETGVWKGTVVVGEMVAVMMTPPLVVGRRGAEYPTPVVVKPPLPAGLQRPLFASAQY